MHGTKIYFLIELSSSMEFMKIFTIFGMCVYVKYHLKENNWKVIETLLLNKNLR
jgi:hypothetical protein